MRLLIVRLSSLGDVIHALPIAANARRSGAEVAWVVETAYRDLLEGNPDVDRVFFADTKRWRRRLLSPRTMTEIRALSRSFREFAPDAVIDVQGLWKSALLARAAGAPVVGFGAADRREPASAVLCDLPVQPLPGRHVVDRNLALAEAAGLAVGERAPDARFLLAKGSPEADAFLAEQPRPFAVYHPGAGQPEKTWGETRFAALADLLAKNGRLSAVVSWGPGDEERARKMSGMLPHARTLPLLSLPGLARVVAASSLFVAGDTGPLHLADALGVPTLALFGPTDPVRNGPYRSPGSAIHYDVETGTEEVARKAFEVLAA
jgi:lipopolysaccharide heptosyltransferase I